MAKPQRLPKGSYVPIPKLTDDPNKCANGHATGSHGNCYVGGCPHQYRPSNHHDNGGNAN